jgi:hypothetical protein
MKVWVQSVPEVGSVCETQVLPNGWSGPDVEVITSGPKLGVPRENDPTAIQNEDDGHDTAVRVELASLVGG